MNRRSKIDEHPNRKAGTAWPNIASGRPFEFAVTYFVRTDFRPLTLSALDSPKRLVNQEERRCRLNVE